MPKLSLTFTFTFTPLLLLFTILVLSAPSASSSPYDHRYNAGDRVPLFVNKVGPLNNPSETYQYYDLPFCQPDPITWKKESLGEVLNGDRMANALYDLRFLEEKVGVSLCQKKLKVDEIVKFRKAVINDFYFQMYYDDLPLWGYVGKIVDESWAVGEKKSKYYLFTHVQFDASYNYDQVVEIRAFSDPTHVVDITDDIEINVKFSYSIFWNATSADFKTRMNKYSRTSSMLIHRKIHWFSFINSVVIILLLMGLLILLFMRRRRNDLRRCSSRDEEEDKEVGWKFIHGDVFGCPRNISLFSAVLGVGNQLLTMVCLLFVLAFLGILYPYNRGLLSTSLVILYSLTSVVAGYTTSSFHNQFSDAGWERSVLLAGILYLGPLFVTASILNTVAASYGATAALPFGTILLIFFIYTFLALPLLALGGLIGYWFRSALQAPSAVKRYPREIPPSTWYQKTPCQMFLVGLLSFSATALELHHLYASLWGYKICTLPSVLIIMFIILIVLIANLSVGLTYIQLSMEEHEWWWRSVLRGGSTAIFMFAYSIYFYVRSNMTGFLQLSFFLGYNAAMCYAFFFMLGTISFHASLIFVHRIYNAVKSE